MLERQGLTIGPYAPGPAGRRRPVRDAATGEELGTVRPLSAGPRWLSWLLPSAFAVHEAEDEPLLCMVRGGWGRAWSIYDADGHLVGEVRRGVLYFFDARGEVTAALQSGPERGAGRFRGGSGAALAMFSTGESGVLLTFLPGSEGDPLMRMTLLAATITATR